MIFFGLQRFIFKYVLVCGYVGISMGDCRCESVIYPIGKVTGTLFLTLWVLRTNSGLLQEQYVCDLSSPIYFFLNVFK